MRSRNMGKIGFSIMLVMLWAVILWPCPGQAAHGKKGEVKKGILLVAFGTSVPEARIAFKNIDQKVKAAFPGWEVRWAYTSKIIRKKLAKEGQMLDAPAVALAKMQDDGFTHIAVQSLHTIPGEEYSDLSRTVAAFAHLPEGIEKIMLGRPLLYGYEDMVKAVDAMTADFPKERKKGEAMVLMGHGTPHAANVYYPGMQYYFWAKDPLVFVGTVEGSPSVEDVLAALKKQGVKKVWLMPFMAVAGDHARNDMAGPEEDSWKSILTKAGFECAAVLKGTAEFDNIAALWVDHLKIVVAHLD